MTMQTDTIPYTLEPGHVISHIEMDDMDELVRLHSEYINYGSGVRPHFERAIEDPFTIALKYEVEGEIAGIMVYTKGIFFSGSHEELRQKILTITGGESCYTGDAALVRKKFRHMGVSSGLCAYSREAMLAQGGVYVVHELWVHPSGKVPARRLVPRFGETCCLGQYKDFYRDFYHYGYICPLCGKDCRCSAELYLSKMV
ncbi:hypothetical protein U6B65_14915 (plasmid) [Oscillospiraceae bacterium MB08-C2-2]|nr:hypothetical protein U6B65_14915 [Oscillospiraceae bacterium MB08-C2-2]